MIRITRSRVALAHAGQHPRMLLVAPGQQLGRVGDEVDQVAHLALRLGHRRHEALAPGGLGEPDVPAHVGLPERGEVLQRCRPSPRRARRAGSSAAGSARSAASTAIASSTASRWSHTSRQPASSSARRRLGGRRGLGHERPAAAPARGVEVPALHERRQRLAQRRARDAELPAQLALGGQPRARLEQPELDRGAEPLERLLVGRLRLDRREDRVAPTSAAASQPLEPPEALPVGDGGLERAQLDVGVVEVVRDDVLAERLARDVAGRRTARARRAACPARAACRPCRRCPRTRGSSSSSASIPCRPDGDHRGEREVRVDVAAGHAVLDAQARAVADDAQRARAVVLSPGDRGRRERALRVALVGVDVRREEQRQLAQAGELAGDEAVEQLRLVAEQDAAVLARAARGGCGTSCPRARRTWPCR